MVNSLIIKGVGFFSKKQMKFTKKTCEYTIKLLIFAPAIGRLAQLVQSTSFTPRGSGVRTPHRPQQTPKSMTLEFFFV